MVPQKEADGELGLLFGLKVHVPVGNNLELPDGDSLYFELVSPTGQVHPALGTLELHLHLPGIAEEGCKNKLHSYSGYHNHHPWFVCEIEVFHQPP